MTSKRSYEESKIKLGSTSQQPTSLITILRTTLIFLRLRLTTTTPSSIIRTIKRKGSMMQITKNRKRSFPKKDEVSFVHKSVFFSVCALIVFLMDFIILLPLAIAT